mmetsp:Transcript_45366/g.83976  ORF Transcript_45366/g.83976 Transcript_45366/m.83976 type:complete len:350 (+) Transcript_45366:5586-6635(+)
MRRRQRRGKKVPATGRERLVPGHPGGQPGGGLDGLHARAERGRSLEQRRGGRRRAQAQHAGILPRPGRDRGSGLRRRRRPQRDRVHRGSRPRPAAGRHVGRVRSLRGHPHQHSPGHAAGRRRKDRVRHLRQDSLLQRSSDLPELRSVHPQHGTQHLRRSARPSHGNRPGRREHRQDSRAHGTVRLRHEGPRREAGEREHDRGHVRRHSSLHARPPIEVAQERLHGVPEPYRPAKPHVDGPDRPDPLLDRRAGQSLHHRRLLPQGGHRLRPRRRRRPHRDRHRGRLLDARPSRLPVRVRPDLLDVRRHPPGQHARRHGRALQPDQEVDGPGEQLDAHVPEHLSRRAVRTR